MSHAQLWKSWGGTGHKRADSKVAQVPTSINVYVLIDLCAVTSHRVRGVRHHTSVFGSIPLGLRSGGDCRKRPKEG